MTIKKFILRFLLILFLTPVVAVTGVFLNYHLISWIASGRIYDQIEKLPSREYALVMGAGNYEPDKWINHSFDHRMIAVEMLYSKRKMTKIIVSGKNVPGDYNEPEEMKSVLVQLGIPAENVLMDLSGERTWLSVLGVKENFKLKKIVIISQRGQLERAIFLARSIGIDAIGYVAEPTPRNWRYWQLREYLARLKCVADSLGYYLKIS
jgi:SanA protein